MVKINLVNLARSEILSGFLLIITFIVAICFSNIPFFQECYRNLVFLPISFGYGEFVYQCSLINLVNDGLMTLFFLLIGLELKYHLVCGEFQHRKSLILPGVAAIGGIVVPLLVYFCFNYDSSTLRGWAIPIATDTAFMLGILSFFGKLISRQLRAFIIGFSLIDDALALCILAFFYTKSPSMIAVVASLILMGILILLNLFRVERSFYYLSVGVILWVAMVHAGIHGTLCGVILAFVIPVQINGRFNPSFHGLENVLRPIVYFGILPLFAFLNSGISFDNFSYAALTSNISLGIIFGLFIGKQVGIFSFSYVAVWKNWCSLPDNVSWLKFYAVSILGGVGFTLSLFIGDLTFETAIPNYEMRVGVIIGSLLSALFGVMILFYLSHKKGRLS